MAKVIFVSYAGYPFTPSSFLPDGGLAGLAAILIRQGCQVKIIDFGTVDTMRRLFPENIHNPLTQIYHEFNKLPAGWRGKVAKLRLGTKLIRLDRQLRLFQTQEVRRIAQELVALVAKEKPDFVGFKLWLGDGFEGSVIMAQALKNAFPRLKVFGGGPQVDVAGEEIYKVTDVFDALCRGEGEPSIAGLLNYCEGKIPLRDVPNILFAFEGKIIKTPVVWVKNLDELPDPAYEPEIYPAMSGDQKIKMIVFDESRGCPFQCHFCPHSAKSGKQWRLKSTKRIIEQMERFIQKFQFHCFRCAGSSTPSKTLFDIAQALLEKKLDVLYTSFLHVGVTDISYLPVLKKSGCYALFFGVESGDDEILSKMMQKHSTAAEIRKVLNASLEAGIFTVGSIIYPAPGETKASTGHTLSLLAELFASHPNCGSVPVQFPGLYPTTEWGNHPEQYGFKLKNPETYKMDMLNYKIKLLFPPKYWDPLPYSVDGKSFRQFSSETEQMINDLENLGIVTMMSDENALIGKLAGFGAKEYRSLAREIFFCGDWRTFQEQVKTINAAITSPDTGIRRQIRESPCGTSS